MFSGQLQFGIEVFYVLGLAIGTALVLAPYAWLRTGSLWGKKSSEAGANQSVMRSVVLEVGTIAFVVGILFFGLIWLSALDSGLPYAGWAVFLDASVWPLICMVAAFFCARIRLRVLVATKAMDTP